MRLAVVQHAALGAVVAGGGVAAAQCVLARRLQAPGSFALALGSFVGVFRLVEASGRERGDGAVDAARGDPNSAQAAAVAAAVALALLDSKRKNVMISYAAIEALITLAREHSTLADIKYIEIPLGVPVYAQIIHTWVMKSELFERSHVAALDGLCSLDASVLQRMRDEIPTGKLLSRCDVFHRGETCAQFHSGLFAKSMRFAARLYIPIYFVSTVLTKYKQWLWGPRPELSRLALQYIRTCLCLTLNYQIPLFISCHSPIQSHRVTVTIAGALAALALLAEHERRRASVLKAVAVYSLCSFGAQVSKTLRAPKSAVTSFQYALFAAALAVVFQHPARQSQTLMKLLYGRDIAAPVPRPDAPATSTTPASRRSHK